LLLLIVIVFLMRSLFTHWWRSKANELFR